MFRINRELKRIFSVKKLTISCNRKVHSKKRIFSGIQPTGAPHIGNYFGAIKKWTSLQNEGKDCIFCVVDLHSITIPRDPEKLRHDIHLMTACLLACGIDPDKSTFFLQSQVPQHAELAWILGCLTTMARLTHLPQYKIETSDTPSLGSMMFIAGKNQPLIKSNLSRNEYDFFKWQEKSALLENVPLGLFTYPVLQCADILLYKATDVPVGEDQVQHIQLCQHLARFFNNKYKKIFPVPEASTDALCARIKSLRDPEKKKMSKSDKDFKNRIDLTDDPDTILKRIKQALTDFTSAVTYEPEKRPGISNIVLIHSLCTGKSAEDICLESGRLDTGQYKLVVAEALIEHLRPIQREIGRYMDDPLYLSQVLQRGSEKAMYIACKTVAEVKEAVGLSSHNDVRRRRGEATLKM